MSTPNALNLAEFPTLATCHGLATGRPPDPLNHSSTAPPPHPRPLAINPMQTAAQQPQPSTLEALSQSHQIPPQQPQSPVSQRALKKSFLTIATSDKPPLIPISRNPMRYKDRPATMFFEDEIVTLAQPFQYLVVGKFSRMPRMIEIRLAFTRIWLTGA